MSTIMDFAKVDWWKPLVFVCFIWLANVLRVFLETKMLNIYVNDMALYIYSCLYATFFSIRYFVFLRISVGKAFVDRYQEFSILTKIKW